MKKNILFSSVLVFLSFQKSFSQYKEVPPVCAVSFDVFNGFANKLKLYADVRTKKIIHELFYGSVFGSDYSSDGYFGGNISKKAFAKKEFINISGSDLGYGIKIPFKNFKKSNKAVETTYWGAKFSVGNYTFVKDSLTATKLSDNSSVTLAGVKPSVSRYEFNAMLGYLLYYNSIGKGENSLMNFFIDLQINVGFGSRKLTTNYSTDNYTITQTDYNNTYWNTNYPTLRLVVKGGFCF